LTIIVDAGPVLSFATLAHPAALSAARLVKASTERLVMSAQVAGEIDYMLQSRIHPAADRPFLDDLAEGRYRVECLTASDYDVVRVLNQRYADLNVGLSDLSIVILAARFNTTRSHVQAALAL
jgi:predicted nucleic acid-binding protein